MNKKYISILFVGVLLYTIFGIYMMRNSGGPCGAGLMYFVFGPFILAIWIIQVLSFYFVRNKIVSAGLSFFAFFLSAFISYPFFLEMDRTVFYILPFGLLNLFLLIITIFPAIVNKSK